MVFKGTSIFSQTNFVPAYIISFNFMMSFVGIFVHKSFTFSVSDLVLDRRQGGFLFRDDSSNGIYIRFFPLGSMFEFVCLLSMDHCHVVFGKEFLAFLYLVYALHF